MLHLLVTEIDRYQTLAHAPKKIDVPGTELNQDTCLWALIKFFSQPDFECEPFQIADGGQIAYLWDEERDYQIILLSVS